MKHRMTRVRGGGSLVGGNGDGGKNTTAEPPAWLDDAANSKWLLFGPTGVVENRGISPRDKGGGEGDLTPAVRDGVACIRSVRADGTLGCFYLLAEPWNAFAAWLGDNDVLLTMHYFDRAPGTLVIKYDSSDPRVRHDPYPAGVWRTPDACPQGVKLEGSKTWKTLTARLPFAYFTKRVHRADLRLDVNAADFALAGVAFSRVPKAELNLAELNHVKVVENARLRLEMDPYGVKSLFDKKANKSVSRAAAVHDAWPW